MSWGRLTTSPVLPSLSSLVLTFSTTGTNAPLRVGRSVDMMTEALVAGRLEAPRAATWSSTSASRSPSLTSRRIPVGPSQRIWGAAGPLHTDDLHAEGVAEGEDLLQEAASHHALPGVQEGEEGVEHLRRGVGQEEGGGASGDQRGAGTV